MNKLFYLPSVPTPFEAGLVGFYYGSVQTYTNGQFQHLHRNVLIANMVVNGFIYGIVEWYFDRIWLLMLLHLIYTLYHRREGRLVFAPVLQIWLSDPIDPQEESDSSDDDSFLNESENVNESENENPVEEGFSFSEESVGPLLEDLRKERPRGDKSRSLPSSRR